LFAILLLLVLSTYYAKRIKHTSFSILWFFITLIPVANIIPIKILIAERFLYLPRIGFAILVAVVLRFLYIRSRKKPLIKYPILLFSVFLILAYTYLTSERNQDWSDEVVFNEKVIEMYPDNPRVHYNLAFALMRREQDTERAYAEASEAVRIMPEHYRARMLLASQYVYMGKPEEAVRELKKVIEIKPDLSDAYEKLALVYQIQGKYDEAMAQYKRSLAWNKLDLDANRGLAGLYALKGESKKAIRMYEEITSKEKFYYPNPRYAAIYLDLGVEYAFSGRGAKAQEAWSRVYEKFGDQTPLGIIARFLIGKITLEDLSEAMKKWPQKYRAMGYYYIGIKKELAGDKRGAIDYYKRCLKVPTKSIENVTVYADQRLSVLQM
jgi:tetratricopeptide (TPR) repeat protein